MKLLVFISLLLLNVGCKKNMTVNTNHLSRIDSLFNKSSFNGIVLLGEAMNTFIRIKGYSNFDKKTELSIDDQFVIGSISKQITAILVLRAYENKRLDIHESITMYLPNIKKSWFDKITVHHLLTHSHGIYSFDREPKFEPGTRFEYSQYGYQILTEILEKTSGKSFIQLSSELFKLYGLNNTFHPGENRHSRLVNAYTEESPGIYVKEEDSFENYVAAGGFVSTAHDLLKWNDLLYNFKLIKKNTLDLMVKRFMTREHPIFGKIEYGYGLTYLENEKNIQIGALGFAPGFLSASFYYPKTKTTLVVLENLVKAIPDFKKTFHVHLKAMDIIKEYSNEK